MGDERERFTKSNRKSSDESLSRVKNESSSGIRVISGILGTNWCTPRICVVAIAFLAIAVDVISESAREEMMNKYLYADDLVLMSEVWRI